MTSPDLDLSDWVAVKKDIFVANDDNEKISFICGWNNEEEKIAIIFHEGSRKASDHHEKNKATLLTITELNNINQQLCFIDPSVNSYYPIFSKTNNTFLPVLFPTQPQIYEETLKLIEHYLYSVVRLLGKKLALSVIFGEEYQFSDYEENVNELRLKTLENAVTKFYADLEEILTLRKRVETLLEMKTIYALEDEIAGQISVSLSELYNFQLQPFIELRELSHTKLSEAKQRLKDEIGPNIKKLAQFELEDWNEQYFTAAEALQQLYHEYYRKALNLVLAQRDRMLEDQKRFGKAAFCHFALPRLEKLEIQVCQEKLKLLNTIKATQEYQRDKLKQQFTFVSSDSNAIREVARIEEEVCEAQKNVFDSHLEVLDIEERLYKTQLAILNREFADDLEIGIFYEAVENVEELDRIECDTAEQNPKVIRLKEKLNKLYRKRASIRNRKKALTLEERKKKERKAINDEKEKKCTIMKRPEKKIILKEVPSEKLKEERKKTLQRLRAFKKKSYELAAKAEDSEVVQSAFQVHEFGRIDSDQARRISNLKLNDDHTSNEEEGISVIDFSAQVQKDHPSSSALQKTTEIVSSIPILPPPPPPLPRLVLPPPPPPPPPRPSSIPPPPPPPPPPGLLFISKVPADLSKVVKKPALKDLKATTSVQPFKLDEILSMRSKLRKPSLDTERCKIHSKNEPADFSDMLQSTMRRIRNMTENSEEDTESDQNSDFD